MISTEQAADLYLERIRQRQTANLSAQDKEDRIRKIKEKMDAQVQVLLPEWTPPPTQQIIYAKEEPEEERVAEVAGAVAAAEKAEPTKIAIKAGTIMFGVLEIGINSDEESPIMASIVQGKLKGSKLLGSFKRLDQRVLITFNSLDVPSLSESVKINAVAIDANTARTAIADRVDNHYMLRYGSLFAAAFLEGLSTAIQESGAEIADLGIIGFTITRKTYSPAEIVGVAMGEVGAQYSNYLSKNFETPPTVYVEPGSGIGILFMEDLKVPVSEAGRLADLTSR